MTLDKVRLRKILHAGHQDASYIQSMYEHESGLRLDFYEFDQTLDQLVKDGFLKKEVLGPFGTCDAAHDYYSIRDDSGGAFG